MNSRRLACIIGMSLAVMVALGGPVPKARAQMMSYAAKFACGAKKDDDSLVVGRYETVINVHNPHMVPVYFMKKAVIALPERSREPGPISQFREEKLDADVAMGVNCKDIRSLFAPWATGFVEGFLVLHVPAEATGAAPPELDVTAVYTARPNGKDLSVASIDVEDVRPKKILERAAPGLADLVPEPDPTGQFCKLGDNQQLIVTIRNIGAGPAGPSRTRVDMGRHGTVDLITPALAPGDAVDLMVEIPLGAFDPDFDFMIEADVGGNVPESDETNNIAGGMCLG